MTTQVVVIPGENPPEESNPNPQPDLMIQLGQLIERCQTLETEVREMRGNQEPILTRLNQLESRQIQTEVQVAEMEAEEIAEEIAEELTEIAEEQEAEETNPENEGDQGVLEIELELPEESESLEPPLKKKGILHKILFG